MPAAGLAAVIQVPYRMRRDKETTSTLETDALSDDAASDADRLSLLSHYPHTPSTVALSLSCGLNLLLIFLLVLLSAGVQIGMVSQPIVATAKLDQLQIYMLQHDWCEMYHGGAIMAMCADSTITAQCEIIYNRTLLSKKAAARSSEGDTFAVPIIVNPRTGFAISQSVAATQFVGEHLGFAASVTNGPKAMQYLLDLRDFVIQLQLATYGMEPEEVVQRFSEKYATGRFDLWLENFERSIEGPFFFGADRTYVDFFLLTTFQWVAHRLHGSISFPGKFLQNYTKVSAVLRGMGMELGLRTVAENNI